jgi:hypothetical protein
MMRSFTSLRFKSTHQMPPSNEYRQTGGTSRLGIVQYSDEFQPGLAPSTKKRSKKMNGILFTNHAVLKQYRCQQTVLSIVQ